MALPAPIEVARDELQECGWPDWHVNDMMGVDEAQSEVENEAQERLVWLAFFTVRHFLSCRELCCDTDSRGGPSKPFASG